MYSSQIFFQQLRTRFCRLNLTFGGIRYSEVVCLFLLVSIRDSLTRHLGLTVHFLSPSFLGAIVSPIESTDVGRLNGNFEVSSSSFFYLNGTIFVKETGRRKKAKQERWTFALESSRFLTTSPCPAL